MNIHDVRRRRVRTPKSVMAEWAENELRVAGLFDADSDYDGMVGPAVMALVNVFVRQGHSGYSASLVSDIFYNLANWKPLNPLTNRPDEWLYVEQAVWGETGGIWQSKRSPDCFSKDGGKTYYSIGDYDREIKVAADGTE